MEHIDILTSVSGEKITDKETWESFRREEIRELFSDYVYGHCPVGKPEDLSFEVVEDEKNFFGRSITYSNIAISFSGYTFHIKGFIPESDKKVPAFIYIMHEFEEKRFDFRTNPNCEYVPLLDITSRGYAVFVMPTSGIYPDWEHKSDYKDGVYSVLSPRRDLRKGNDWATVSAWAWGASRAMDYVETLDTIDTQSVAVAGHSRGGKTALWCAANDKRFALAVSNASGCMGAAMLRGKTGEHIKDINTTDWFCGNFKRFNDREELLPVDQHMLLSLIAPRLIYVESCSEDDWADPKNERLSCRLVSEVYNKIYGIKGAVLPNEPVKADTSYHGGNIGYHMKTGNHSITPVDWKQFMDFWDKKRLEKLL